MYITLISLLFALIRYQGGSGEPLLLPYGAALLFVAAPCILLAGAFSSLQKGEQKGTPKLIELVKRDFKLQGSLTLLFLLGFLPLMPETALGQAAVILLTGFGLDALRFFANRLLDHLNPFKIVGFLENDAVNAIKKDRDDLACRGIDAIGEAGQQALHRHNSALAIRSIDSLKRVGAKFFATEKSLGHPIQSAELQKEGVQDTLSFVFLLILQHLEALYTSALEKRMELVLNHLIAAFTELSIFASKTDLTLAQLPLHYVKKLSLKAVERKHADVGVKTSIGLLELARRISDLKDLKYLDIKPSYHLILSTLDEIAKNMFRQDKSVEIALIVRPIRDLQMLFEKSPLKDHEDTPIIKKQIEAALAEFQALDNLLKTMPPLPTLSQEKGQQTASPPA